MKLRISQGATETSYWLWCPGCNEAHRITNLWEFNGNIDAPTFSPSILVTKHANPKAIEKFKEWRTERRCHSFLRDGVWEFLGDSTHALAGQNVPMVDLPDWLANDV